MTAIRSAHAPRATRVSARLGLAMNDDRWESRDCRYDIVPIPGTKKRRYLEENAGRAMLAVAKRGGGKTLLENPDINALAAGALDCAISPSPRWRICSALRSNFALSSSPT